MFTAEAIPELELDVKKPRGPVELGQRAEYTIELTNIGTKAAENVESAMLFGRRLEPIDVEGSVEAVHNDGQVLFKNIPMILPKECVTLKVITKADVAGMAQVKTHVVSSNLDIPLEHGLATTIVNRQRGVSTASGQATQGEVVR
jgi:hypothetical protein